MSQATPDNEGPKDTRQAQADALVDGIWAAIVDENGNGRADSSVIVAVLCATLAKMSVLSILGHECADSEDLLERMLLETITMRVLQWRAHS